MELVLDDYEPPEKREVIPDGTNVLARVVSIREKQSNFDEEDFDGNKILDENGNPRKKMQVSFKFVIDEGEYKGAEVFGNTNTTFTKHPSCKLRIWVQEILNRDSLKPGFKLDTEMLEGLTCRVNVAVRNGKWPDGTAKQTNYVSDVFRDSSEDSEPF
jgi:hypothetical protein